MQFTTSIHIPPASWSIDYNDQILLLGSCFADSMAEKLKECYFQFTSNPLGTLYNPLSIADAILSAQQQRQIDAASLVEWGGLYHSFMHHGVFSHADKDVVLARCNASLKQLYNALSQSSVIAITFGSAWVYEYDGKVVANCHKIPSQRFVRRQLTVDEIVSLWTPIIQSMPNKRWVFTVSPIRHLKDGLHNNQISKGILLQAIDALTNGLYPTLHTSSHVDEKIYYFPSYEIMMDELRDYRYYAEDMVHPSTLAVEYIWKRFVDTFMTSSTQKEMKELHQLWRDQHHTILHPESKEAKQFISNVNQRVQELKKRYPWLAENE